VGSAKNPSVLPLDEVALEEELDSPSTGVAKVSVLEEAALLAAEALSVLAGAGDSPAKKGSSARGGAAEVSVVSVEAQATKAKTLNTLRA
jgi:hypothetical protein